MAQNKPQNIFTANQPQVAFVICDQARSKRRIQNGESFQLWRDRWEHQCHVSQNQQVSIFLSHLWFVCQVMLPVDLSLYADLYSVTFTAESLSVNLNLQIQSI